MLRSLSKDWNSLKMLIENTKDVNTYPLEELYRTLMTYELNNIETKEKTRRSKEDMKEPHKKNGEDFETIDDFKRNMIKVKRKTRRSYAMIVTNPVIRGPNARTKRSSPKRKLFKLHRDDSDEDDIEEDEVQEEIANICFMAIEDEISTNNNDSYIDLSTSYDEILEEFEKLVSKYSIINNKHALLKNVVNKLFIAQKDFEKEKDNHKSLIKENLSLKEKVVDLKSIIHKFTQ
ncbi:Uncharacterized protein Adt_15806 [Abeliophyllum distichum]|uniref:UBN2 domain-containing protein n=1 Tax=Abeliophyllum distichum TaxID=126358 RepID=A0ABD1U3K9_9LAMI